MAQTRETISSQSQRLHHDTESHRVHRSKETLRCKGNEIELLVRAQHITVRCTCTERRVTGFARKLHDFTIQRRNLHSLMNIEMTESDFEKIISSNSTIQTFSYNQLIFRELDEAESLYYVLEGEVDLFLTNTILETMKAGRFIGHESGFIDRIHVVSARCSSESCTVIKIPLLVAKTMFKMNTLRAEMKVLSRVPMFRGIARRYVARFLRFARIRLFSPSHVVVRGVRARGARVSIISLFLAAFSGG